MSTIENEIQSLTISDPVSSQVADISVSISNKKNNNESSEVVSRPSDNLNSANNTGKNESTSAMPATSVTPQNVTNASAMSTPTTSQESRTNLIINYIPPSLNEGALGTLFSPFGTMQNIKIVVDPHTGHSRGYGFVKYESEESAAAAQKALNGYKICGKTLKVAFSRPQSKEIENANLYVTNVPLNWDDDRLALVFKPYGDVVECRILVDHENKSKGVAFVRLDNHNNARKAITTINERRLNGETELVVKLAQRKTQNRGPYGMNSGGNYNYGHNNARKSGGHFTQGANENKNTYQRQPYTNAQMSGGSYNKRTAHNRKQMYRRRDGSMNDASSKGDGNFFQYNTYGQSATGYYPNTNKSWGGMRTAGTMSHTNGSSQNREMNQSSMTPNGNRPCYNIVVRNLPDNYNVDHLIKLFASYGPIQSVNIQKSQHHNNGNPEQTGPSYGIVSYFFGKDAKQAVEDAHHKQVGNCVLEVTWQ